MKPGLLRGKWWLGHVHEHVYRIATPTEVRRYRPDLPSGTFRSFRFMIGECRCGHLNRPQISTPIPEHLREKE